MKYFTYIIYSGKIDKYYIGHTIDLENRILEHCVRRNLGADDWTLKHFETFNSRSDAMKRESEIKKKKKRSYIEQILSNAG
jgi:putative endonuclease